MFHRVLRYITLFILTVKYAVKVYTPDSHVKSEYRLTVRIKGDGEQKTADHVLHDATQETEGYAMFWFSTGSSEGI